MAGETRKRLSWSLQPSQLLWKLSDRARQFREAQTLAPNIALGHRGEDLAHRYLRRAGYQVVARNYKPGPDSEVDIIARSGDVLVFIEVKARLDASYGAPDRAVGPEKERHILRAARSYLSHAGLPWDGVRFDIISIVFTDPPSLSHYQDAFFPGR